MKRKFNEAIKEDKEEKDSLFNEIKFKSQAAMEYLMTYGWAILIIALSLAVLYSLGIMNPKNFVPRAPPGSCFVFRPNGPGTTDFVSLQGTCGYLPMYVASFNGNNSYVSVPSVPVLHPTQAITVAAWVKKTINNQGAVVRTYSDYFLDFNNGPALLRWSINAHWDYVTSYPNDGRWHFIVGTYDRVKLGYFIDGKLVQTINLTEAINNNNQPIRIGTRGDLYTNYFNGSLANIQIYNTALTPQEIQYLYQQGLGGGPVRLQNLVGWWPLNGDAKDYSGNNNHGTINGGVTFVQNYNPP